MAKSLKWQPKNSANNPQERNRPFTACTQSQVRAGCKIRTRLHTPNAIGTQISIAKNNLRTACGDYGPIRRVRRGSLRVSAVGISTFLPVYYARFRVPDHNSQLAGL
jgi:hypothetical protein